MKINSFLFIVLTISLFSACKERSNNEFRYEVISIDLSKLIDIDICDSSKVTHIPLELTDNSLLSHIEYMELKDNEVFVYDTHRIMVFDVEGNFLWHLNRKGNGPGEYTTINSFFLNDNMICLYDDNIQTLFKYDTDGTFVEATRTTEIMSSIYPVGGKKFVGKKKYRGDRMQTPTLAMLNSNLELLFNISNRNLTSGVGVFDYCYSYDDEILYWEFLNDTIYSVDNENLTPKFYVDFQKFKIPAVERENKQLSEIIEYINHRSSKHAAGVRYVQEDSQNIRFIFAFDESLNYAIYNKQTKQVSLYRIYDSSKTLKLDYFMKYYAGKVILVANNPEDLESNPILLFIDEKIILEASK